MSGVDDGALLRVRDGVSIVVIAAERLGDGLGKETGVRPEDAASADGVVSASGQK